MGGISKAHSDVVVSFIIVNYRTPELVVQCIQSIRQYCSGVPAYEIIVVDNDSQDHSLAVLSHCEGIHLLRNKANIGFAGANNRGAAVARGKYLYLLNSDTYLLHDVLSVLVDYMEDVRHAHVAICGTDLLDAAGQKQAAYGNFPSVLEVVSQFGFDRFYKRYYAQRLSQGVRCDFEEPRTVDYVSGASMFIRAAVYRRLNGLDEDYFLYFEETDFSFRVRRLGYQSVLLPRARVVHLEGSSHQGQGTNNWNKRQHYTRSRILFFKKNKGRAITFFVRILLIFQAFLAGLRRADSTYFKLMYRIAKV